MPASQDAGILHSGANQARLGGRGEFQRRRAIQDN